MEPAPSAQQATFSYVASLNALSYLDSALCREFQLTAVKKGFYALNEGTYPPAEQKGTESIQGTGGQQYTILDRAISSHLTRTSHSKLNARPKLIYKTAICFDVARKWCGSLGQLNKWNRKRYLYSDGTASGTSPDAEGRKRSVKALAWVLGESLKGSALRTPHWPNASRGLRKTVGTKVTMSVTGGLTPSPGHGRSGLIRLKLKANLPFRP
ncbi:hypothetical protein EVAR_90216_1 [Eumeta japonica]|uniref:Uncharacterized protein n=1 Tax=Eumeta variegata TaxID=151549 RepID=A0A4C1WYP7_EUMVA|nr:hypothetical protein EVAR_90216_1 [Eumeta japonica]